mmetsp:Transcript_28244/g.71500  ORF Transcript_28244/g.71500 Transcript_28244/m.71500 type:complete len:210 (-) Transcript_28244:358-987(-)
MRRIAATALRIPLLGAGRRAVAPVVACATLGAATAGVLLECVRHPTAPSGQVLAINGLSGACSCIFAILTVRLIPRSGCSAPAAFRIPTLRPRRCGIAPVPAPAALAADQACVVLEARGNIPAPCRYTLTTAAARVGTAIAARVVQRRVRARARRAAAAALRNPLLGSGRSIGAPTRARADQRAATARVLLKCIRNPATPRVNVSADLG